MRKLLINILIFGGPLLVCLLFFVISDPFGVVYKSECLAETSGDMVVIRKYLNEYKTNSFTSFIFGNSRTHAFKNEGYCGSSNNPIFDFGSPGESVLNIKKKLQFVLQKQNKIKNAVILIDDGILENTNNEHKFYQGSVYNHTPISSNISYLSFYTNYIKYYFNNYFFVKHIYYTITGNYKEAWMKDAFKKPGVDINYKCSKYPTLADSLIETNFMKYKSVFKPDYNSYSEKNINLNEIDIEHFLEISKILKENNINYKIVYSPSFNKRKVKPEIKNFLSKTFPKHFYDFTGINKITTDSTLNYENLHFTCRAAKMIMDSICLNTNEY